MSKKVIYFGCASRPNGASHKQSLEQTTQQRLNLLYYPKISSGKVHRAWCHVELF